MNEHTPLVLIRLSESKSAWPLKRPQRWSWIAKNGHNFRTLAKSSENYTNRQDCLDAAALLFGPRTNVVWYERGVKGEYLRRANDSAPF